jgi:peptide/nickel transport system permease protein
VIRYVGRRILQLIPMLLGITVITFTVMQLAPGDFLSEMRMNPVVSPERIEQMRQNFGLDQPKPVQYWRWLTGLLRGDFGFSFAFQIPVLDLIRSRLGNTLLLNIASFLFAWIVAVPLGIYSALNKYRVGDNLLTVAALLGISAPTFFTGLVGLYLAYLTGWLPIGGMTSVEYDFMDPAGKALDVAWHLVLPVLILGFGGVAGLMRQMRGNMLEVLEQDYVRTARSKGLARGVVIWKHAVRNAINPLVTLFGFALGGLLSGSAILENIIGWPGLGNLLLEAVQKKDLYVVMGSLVIGSVMLVAGNLVSDLLLAYVDPRVRYD